MTDTDINIAIAEACGFTCIELGPYDGHPFGIEPGETKPFTKVRCPNYCADLNAMHEAIMSQPVEIRDKINCALMDMLDPEKPYLLDRTINSTARQRAEAFLRTIGKWKNGDDVK